jgi:hypothetical protein
VPTLSVLSNFDGLSSGQPPDTCGAVGPNSYVETVNTSVAIYNKATGTQIATDGLNDFLFTVGGITAVGGLADATMGFDEVTGQFIVADMDWNSTAHTGALDFAVSKNSNPTALDTANWTFYQVGSESGYDLDYPGNFGFNADAFVYTLQEFAPTGSGLTSHSLVTAISQSDLAAGGTINGVQFDLSGFSYRPVTMHDSSAGGPMWLVQEGGGTSINIVRISSVNVVLFDGNDTVNVENTLSGVPVTINEGGGTDTVNIRPSAEFLDNIQGNVFINGGSGTDTLNVYDQNDTFSDTWTMTGSSLTRTAAATIYYNEQSSVNITGGSGNLTYNILSTEDFFSTSLDTGPGTDAVNVQSTGFFSTLTINNTFSTSNQDTVNIGSNAPSLGGTLANIAGTANVNNASGNTTLNVDDSGDATGQTVTVTNSSISGTWSPAAINYSNGLFGTISAVNLYGGSGGNTFNVQSTLGTATTSINTDDTLTASANTVNIGSAAPSLGGTLANIAGPLNVSNFSGSTTLNVDDSGDGTGQTATVTSGSITGTWSPAAINYSNTTFGTISAVNLYGGSGGNTFKVQSTLGSATTSIDADHTLLAAANTVNIGSAAPSLGGTLANIAGPLNVSNFSGSTTLNIDDSGDGTGQTATHYCQKLVVVAPARFAARGGIAPGSGDNYRRAVARSAIESPCGSPAGARLRGPLWAQPVSPTPRHLCPAIDRQRGRCSARRGQGPRVHANRDSPTIAIGLGVH